ncbi:hypothetical protein Pst134EA_020987 [Puccinia striiformis f. sp. tritici]|uniref:hypothetical protein n=1 Tax=Puccinia striiformis f. sp. tritici TaxID=168172 RepID=UPI00200792D1|nr:hypothetical protein Pst134EA_020987 [Puccinia striiformis f. sp. tritici]KAH9457090.1 hypothetical protein Pst134EA_020987 [Puccinia striiformis f. sp. tritici]
MELAQPIVQDIQEMHEEGFPAYDCTLGEEVLIVSTVLCFLADSPMHAEITSTPMPANSLHPCRACDLASPARKDKPTMEYVRQFFMINPDGSPGKNETRSWSKIKDMCHSIWTHSKTPRSKTTTLAMFTELGVRDSINKELLERQWAIAAKKEQASASDAQFLKDVKKQDEVCKDLLFNPFFTLSGFDGCRDTPVELLHVFLLGVVKYMTRDFMNKLKPAQVALVMARYQSFCTDALNIPSLQAYYMTRHFSNFVGKEFKIVLQAAPFVFFEYMSEPQRDLWRALCQLSPLVFQTHIKDMSAYQQALQDHIRWFLFQIAKSTAQWVNKPKLHMLLHLPDSIMRFGPGSLFATEKFESYNSVLRNASIHSNRRSLGHDIAVTFANFRIIRHILAGGYFWDTIKNWYVSAADSVTRMFSENPSVQKTMGYNQQLLMEHGHQEPQVGSRKVLPDARVTPPADLAEFLRGYELNQIGDINLNSKDKIVAGTFILYRFPGPVAAIGIARVDYLWEARSGTSVRMYLLLSLFAKGQVDNFYGMRAIRRTGRRKFVGIEVRIPSFARYLVAEVLAIDNFGLCQCIAACINVQHNCHRRNCAVSWTRGVQVERRDTNIRVAEMAHVDDNDYIVNGASLSSVDVQRAFSDNPCKEITNHQQLTALHEGIAKWHALDTPAGPSGEFSALDPALS